MKLTKSKKIELSEKDIEKLNERISEIEKNLKSFKETYKKPLLKKIDALENKYDDKFTELNNNLRKFNGKISDLQKNFTIEKRKLDAQIKNQEEIIMDMIKKFDAQFLRDKNRIFSELEELKQKQDVLKVSFTVHEEQLLDKIREIAKYEIASAVQGKESELIMRLWLDELKNIISDFNQLKGNKPQEFLFKLNEIKELVHMYSREIQELKEEP